ncbi:MAG: signal peptidase I [Bradymonadia bacterium]
MERFRHFEPRSPRSLAVAIVLTLAMPGLGHVYCGELSRGLRLWMFAFLGLAGFLGAWLYWLFVPWVPLMAVLVAYALFLGWLVTDLHARVEATGPNYALGPANHAVVYLSLFLGLWAGPWLLGQHIARTIRVSAVVVEDEAMFPKLLAGDVVLVDRMAYRPSPPQAGDLVVLRRSGEGPRIARVIATGGHTVQLQSGRPVVDGEALAWEPLDELRVPNFGDGPLALSLASLSGYVERAAAGLTYVVTYAGRPPLDPAPVLLQSHELFVMSDNRGAEDADAIYARTTLDAILGRPRYVWASTSPDGELRASRVGWPVE